MTNLTHRLRIETQFVQLMSELFQLDEAEALDFGIYRVIRYHNREVRAFLGEVVKAGPDAATLQGGLLAALLDDAFRKADHEAAAQDQARLKALECQLGITPGLTQAERSNKLQMLAAIPATKGVVDEYRTLLEQNADSGSAEHDRIEVLNRLYQFFERHYQDGDFIVERRYGRNGARYIRSTGEDTEFHWATEDMYYVKSGDIFTDYPVRLANGQRIVFSVEPESLQATRAQLKPNDKAHYELHDIQDDDGRLQVQLCYRKSAQTDKQREEIVTAIHARTGGDPADIKRWLARFITRNQSDFFIHKRLREALAEDLDIFLKTEVLDAEQLLADRSLSLRALKVGRIVRQVGLQIIDFLAALEDFQKALWEKKKLVLQTRYVITLDRLARHAPDWLAAHIDTIVATQRQEWQALGLGDFPDAAACRQDTPGDLASPAQTRYLPLPVDTAHFGEDFKWSLLAAVSAAVDLDEALDGVAIRSDNWQALNTLQTRFREQVKCVYIDPPYNTGSDGFPYKDSYQSASWLAMMDDRLHLMASVMTLDGAFFSSIDHNEYPKLRPMLERTFGRNNTLGTIVWKNVTDNNPTNIAVEHEYIEAFAKSRSALDSEWKSPFSDAKDVLVSLSRELVEKHGDTPALQRAYQEWIRSNKEFLGPLEGYKFIDKGGIYAGSRSVHNPGKEGYRYDVLHPRTRKPCKQPLMGYRFPEETYQRLLRDGRILFGEDETKLIELKVYAHEYEAKLPSVIELDGRSGANDLTNLFGEAQKFKNPKAPALLFELVPYVVAKGNLVADFFLGSGTTIHALMRLNRKTALRLRWLGVESSHNFDMLVVPRIKKAAFSHEWLKGRPVVEGGGIFARIQTLEQYEDTLENLALPADDVAENDLFDDAAFALRYRLDRTSRRAYCDIAHFASPFGYQLKRVEGGGDAPLVPVDLVESLIYLLGLTVQRLVREPQGVVVTGSNRRGQSVAVLFRDCAATGSAEWVAGKLVVHPADRVYANAVSELSFPGCDRLEAIETVFAGQFGSV